MCMCLVGISLPTGLESIFHEGGDGHGAYAAGDGGDIAAKRGDFVEFDVTFEGKAALFRSVGDAGDADVDDDGARLDHIGGHEFRAAKGCHEDIRLPAYLPEVAGMRMADRYGTVAGIGIAAEQDAHGASYDIATSYDYGVQAPGIDLIMFQQQHDAVGGCRDKGGQPLYHLSYVGGMKAVDILGRVDGVDDLFIRDMFGQGKLYQDPVYVYVIIQVFDDAQELVLADRVFQPDEAGFEADSGAGLYFGAYIGLAGAVVADEYGGQVGDLLSFCF